MRPFVLSIVLACLAVLMLGCADLVVTDFQATGAPSVNAENSVEVPVRATVRNQGTSPADIFKVGTDFTDSAGSTFAVAFTVPGEASIWYPFTDAPLAAGAEETFEGTLTFHPSRHGETVSIVAIADSCSGDEFMPDYCRVPESDETNNVSADISVALP